MQLSNPSNYMEEYGHMVITDHLEIWVRVTHYANLCTI